MNTTLRKWHKYTDEEKEYIRVHDDGTTKTRVIIANILGRTLAGIRHECSFLGLVCWRQDDFEEWEDNYIREYFGRLSYDKIGNRLNRSREKIANRAKVLKLDGESGRDGWYSTGDVAHGFGCTISHIRDLIYEKKLKAKQDEEDGKRLWVIKRDSIYNYIVKYPMSLEGRNCDIVFLVDILTDGNIKSEG